MVSSWKGRPSLDKVSVPLNEYFFTTTSSPVGCSVDVLSVLELRCRTFLELRCRTLFELRCRTFFQLRCRGSSAR